MKTSLHLLASPTEVIKERLQFVQAADRGAHGIPQRKQETDGGVRLFTTRQRLRLPAIAASFCDVRLHVNVEEAILVVDAERATELALTEQVVERDTRSNRDT